MIHNNYFKFQDIQRVQCEELKTTFLYLILFCLNYYNLKWVSWEEESWREINVQIYYRLHSHIPPNFCLENATQRLCFESNVWTRREEGHALTSKRLSRIYWLVDCPFFICYIEKFEKFNKNYIMLMYVWILVLKLKLHDILKD